MRIPSSIEPRSAETDILIAMIRDSRNTSSSIVLRIGNHISC